jgi:hypothetical protein
MRMVGTVLPTTVGRAVGARVRGGTVLSGRATTAMDEGSCNESRTTRAPGIRSYTRTPHSERDMKRGRQVGWRSFLLEEAFLR